MRAALIATLVVEAAASVAICALRGIADGAAWMAGCLIALLVFAAAFSRGRR